MKVSQRVVLTPGGEKRWRLPFGHAKFMHPTTTVEFIPADPLCQLVQSLRQDAHHDRGGYEKAAQDASDNDKVATEVIFRNAAVRARPIKVRVGVAPAVLVVPPFCLGGHHYPEADVVVYAGRKTTTTA